jgi:hypothetical protein
LSAVALLVCAFVLRGLGERGIASRIHGEPFRPATLARDVRVVRVVRNARELHAHYVQHGGRGRVLVNVSRYLHFQEPAIDEITSSRFPLRLFDLVQAYEGNVGVTSHLWVAMRRGLAREIRHVVPPATFVEKRAAARADGTDVVSIGDHAIVLHHWGSRRIISDAVPSLAEPAILVVDASYFEAADPDQLLREIERSGLAADVVALCFADDNPEVGPRGREGLARFASLLEKRAHDRR